jgi:hypothetical protein
MLRGFFIVTSAIALNACTETTSVSDETQRFWYECNFELSKVEIVRGRNLDDLNNGTIARNQFLVDCMASKTPKLPLYIIEDLTRYAEDNSREPSDVTTNRAPADNTKNLAN